MLQLLAPSSFWGMDETASTNLPFTPKLVSAVVEELVLPTNSTCCSCCLRAGSKEQILHVGKLQEFSTEPFVHAHVSLSCFN